MDRDLTCFPKSVCYYPVPWLDTNYWEVKQPSRGRSLVERLQVGGGVTFWKERVKPWLFLLSLLHLSHETNDFIPLCGLGMLFCLSTAPKQRDT